jgi:hypothetical protein
LWRALNPIMAPAVAAAETSPDRTPARIREENTRESKPRSGVHSRDRFLAIRCPFFINRSEAVVRRQNRLDYCDQ